MDTIFDVLKITIQIVCAGAILLIVLNLISVLIDVIKTFRKDKK